MRISDYIRDALEKTIRARGSLNRFAGKTEMNASSLSRYLHGSVRIITPDVWARIMTFAGSDINRFLYGEGLAAAIESKKLSKDALANAAGITVADVEAFIAGTKIPTESEHAAITKVLGGVDVVPYFELAEANGVRQAMTPTESRLPYLRSIRESLGATQQQLAFLSGVHQRGISAMETGLGGASAQYVHAVANTLNVTMDELIYGLKDGSKPKLISRTGGEGDNLWKEKQVKALDGDLQEALDLIRSATPAARLYMLSMLRRLKREDAAVPHAEG